MNNQQLIDLIIEKFDGVLIDDFGWEHYKVDGKEYDIRFALKNRIRAVKNTIFAAKKRSSRSLIRRPSRRAGLPFL